MTDHQSKSPYTSKTSTPPTSPNRLPNLQARPYRIRVSQRAKHVTIRVSHFAEVEVVIPPGFDQTHIPAILEKRQAWLTRALKRVEVARQSVSLEPIGALPESICLRAIDQEWHVHYCTTEDEGLSLHPSPPTQQLLISGQVSQAESCKQVLRQWLSWQAKLHLTPWLRRVSQEVALPCGTVSIRGQKTLWASCSNRKSISLNYKLLFLPAPLVRYVFIHELCHTIHLNHSARFWALVAEKEPHYKPLDKEVSGAWCYVPDWVDCRLES
ncbi:MAG: M48 family metallopeptidase [Leptolyngbyaceae cyanobacterium SL_7_1]|nr:M48 family metallopeptidase [Leptolyngbyaceae cyanobacterium SL_7_1]